MKYSEQSEFAAAAFLAWALLWVCVLAYFALGELADLRAGVRSEERRDVP